MLGGHWLHVGSTCLRNSKCDRDLCNDDMVLTDSSLTGLVSGACFTFLVGLNPSAAGLS